MFKRLFWLVIGVGFGFGLAFWATRFLRETIERYSPERVSDDLAQAIRSFGRDLREAVAEGREAMREREAELLAEIGRNGHNSNGDRRAALPPLTRSR